MLGTSISIHLKVHFFLFIFIFPGVRIQFLSWNHMEGFDDSALTLLPEITMNFSLFVFLVCYELCSGER